MSVLMQSHEYAAIIKAFGSGLGERESDKDDQLGLLNVLKGLQLPLILMLNGQMVNVFNIFFPQSKW